MNSQIFTNFPEYETKRLILRQLSTSDSRLMYEFNSDPECLRFIARSPYTHMSQAEGRVSEFTDAFEQQRAIWWTVILKETSTPIGYCGLFEIDKSVPKAEMGYGFLKSFWGQGYASEAVGEIINKGFEELGFNRIYAHVVPENTSSAQVLIKHGFSYEGLLRKNAYAREKFFDMTVWAKVK